VELGDCGENMCLSRYDEIDFLPFAIALEGPNIFRIWVFLIMHVVRLRHHHLVPMVHKERQHCCKAFGVDVIVT
jgi:hypothetical protein